VVTIGYVNGDRPARRPDRESTSAVALAIAGLGPLVVAAALVSVRGHLVNVNVALILVVVVVLAAVSGGRAAGALAAVMAALSYEFFFTKPYLSLRISDGEDIVTTVLLLAIGLVVGELVVIGRRNRQAAGQAQEGISRLHRVAELAAGGARAEDLILVVESELEELLELDDCTYDVAPFGSPVSIMER
jgi:K+-sensing histidine kinase KdpD